MTIKTILLIASVIIGFASIYPYIKDMVKGATKPNLVTWFTWTLLTGIATVAEYSAGEHITAILTGFETLMTGSIVVLALKYGHAKYSIFDGICQLAAIVGIVLWLVFDSPLLAVIASVTIDFVGTLPTIIHSWRSPHEETARSYGMSAISDALAVGALTVYSPIGLLYLAYNFLCDTLLFLIIIVRDRYVPEPTPRMGYRRVGRPF